MWSILVRPDASDRITREIISSPSLLPAPSLQAHFSLDKAAGGQLRSTPARSPPTRASRRRSSPRPSGPSALTTSRKSHSMTVRNGRELLAIPGPTTVPDEVLSAMHRPAVDLYSGEIINVTMSCIEDLKKIIRTESEPFLYAANGHGAWEAALVNCLSRGDRVLALQSGMFGGAWAGDGHGPRPRRGAAVRTPAPRNRSGCGAGPPPRRPRRPDQGGPRGPDRHRGRDRQRHPGHPAGGDGRGTPRAPHGGHDRVARVHALRDGRLGHRRDGGGVAEGADDASRARVRRGRGASPRRPPPRRPRHPLLGLVVPGRGRALPEGTAARLPST